ncbi:MAG TPA: sortase [Candidatus Pristimantibacillus sp.]|nr:sortase [Candidatus Pristimantibacillus sp.]
MSAAQIVHRFAGSVRLRVVNHVLTGVVALLAIYIAVLPLLPQAVWWFRHSVPVFHIQPAVSLPAPQNEKKEDRPKVNTLVIPSLDMTQEIFEGRSVNTLLKGPWRRPATSTPDKGGNTVIAGHRFYYSRPAVFYFLDKIKVGDPITVYWNGERYDYVVSESKVVPPEATDVENNTKDSELTLYTCTPLWTSSKRLVIVAKLTGHES